MKSYPPKIAYTIEDALIWARVDFGGAPGVPLHVQSMLQDRTDAELMHCIQRIRSRGWRTRISTWLNQGGGDTVERIIGGRLL